MDSGQDTLEPNLAILEHWAEEHGSVDPASAERESNTVCKIKVVILMFLHIGTRTILNHNLAMILYLWPSRGPGAFTDGYQHATETSYQSHPGHCLLWKLRKIQEIEPLNVSHLLNELAPCEPSHAPSPPLCPKFKTQLNSFGLF